MSEWNEHPALSEGTIAAIGILEKDVAELFGMSFLTLKELRRQGRIVPGAIIGRREGAGKQPVIYSAALVDHCDPALIFQAAPQ